MIICSVEQGNNFEVVPQDGCFDVMCKVSMQSSTVYFSTRQLRYIHKYQVQHLHIGVEYGGLRGFSPPRNLNRGAELHPPTHPPPPEILQQLTHQSPFTNYRLLVSIGVEYREGGLWPPENVLYGLAPPGILAIHE